MKKMIILAMFFCLTFTSFDLFAETFLTLGGKQVSGEDFKSNDKVLLKFWTTWCPYCKKQLNFLKPKLEELEKEGFKIYLINIGESQGKVVPFIDKLGIDQKYVILNKNSSLASKYKVRGFPTYIFLYKGEEVQRTNFLTDQSLKKFINIYKTLGAQ